MGILDDILDGDDGLLASKPVVAVSTESDRVRSAFEEINLFVDREGHRPGAGPGRPGIAEYTLVQRLNGIIAQPHLVAALRPFDRHGLLTRPWMHAVDPPADIDGILDADDGLLSAKADDIFVLRHVSAGPLGKSQPDWITDRQPCRDFARFEPILSACQAELDAGARKAVPFAKESEIAAGDFYIVNGMLLYVAEKRNEHKRGKGKRRDARLHCVFANGTEYRPFLRSLSRALYRDPAGRKISDPQAGPLFGDAAQRETGYVYILRSLSADPAIAGLEHLHKIGFTTGDVQARIRNAAQEPTYLRAPVHLLMTIKLHGVSSQRFEALIHRFLGEVRLDLRLTDAQGRSFQPREWFLAPLDVIEQAVGMIGDGSIVRHRFDRSRGRIVPL